MSLGLAYLEHRSDSAARCYHAHTLYLALNHLLAGLVADHEH